MVGIRDNLRLAADAINGHKLRSVLTILGLTMGVATLITVMTLVQGANLFVEQKIANLGTNVFRLAKTPFAVVDFTVVVKALKNKNIEMADYRAVAELCHACEAVGASASGTLSVQYQNKQTDDTSIIGHTPSMVDIDTRTLDTGRYFTPVEDAHAAYVCIIGASLVDQFFPNENPIGRTIRTGTLEFTVIGTFQKLGSVLGQDQDNYVVIPLNTYLKVRGSRSSLTLEIKASGGEANFNAAQDEARVIVRSRRHDPPGKEDSFFIGTSQSYISLWQSISGSFFAVFVMVSSISAVVGGIVIMNVMLVSVTQRTCRDRRAPRRGRYQAGYPAPVPHREPSAMPDRRGDRHRGRLRVRPRPAHPDVVSRLGENVGGRPRPGSQLDHRTVLRNLSREEGGRSRSRGGIAGGDRMTSARSTSRTCRPPSARCAPARCVPG